MRINFESHDQCEVLTGIAGGQLLTYASPAKVRRYDAQAIIWTANDRPTRLFALKAGSVEISTLDGAGRETVLRFVKRGELFGELCFCACKDERLGTVARSTAASEIIELPAKEFQASVSKNDRVLNDLLNTFCTRLADAEKRTQILAVHDAQERLVQLLLHLARRRVGSANGRDGRCTFTVSHAELAALAALSRPHVTLLMTRLRSRGLVFYNRGSALSLHLKKLQKEIEV